MALTISAPGVPSEGVQQPRIHAVPSYVSSTGTEAIELAAMAGLYVDPWQELAIHDGLGEREDGNWAAFEVGVEVPRQNGKGGILEVRELAGLFLLGERLVIHSAHEFSTAEEALERMAALIEGCADLSRRVKVIKRSHGQEGIYLTNGQRLRYKTRTKGGGRGFTADCVILDEAMVIPEAFLGALMPTLSARPNPQLWYTGSAVDQEIMDHGIVFARLRERALRGDDPALAYFGWGAPYPDPESVPATAASDPQMWAQANPALGIRIAAAHISNEQRSMDPRTFAVERLGVGDWPATDGSGETVIRPEDWLALADSKSGIEGPVCLAFDVRPSRQHAAIAAAGQRPDGMWHVEVIDHRAGTGWVADRVAEIAREHPVQVIACDKVGPAASLLHELRDMDIDVKELTAHDHAQACGRFFDLVEQGKLRHLGTSEMEAAIRGATRRPLGDAWAWSRKTSMVDISSLVACTLALGEAISAEANREPLIAWR
jgi:hypothetical protein